MTRLLSLALWTLPAQHAAAPLGAPDIARGSSHRRGRRRARRSLGDGVRTRPVRCARPAPGNVRAGREPSPDPRDRGATTRLRRKQPRVRELVGVHERSRRQPGGARRRRSRRGTARPVAPRASDRHAIDRQHAAAFARAKRLLSINGDNNGLASQALIDAACDHRALSLNAIQHLRAVEAAPRFDDRYEFVGPDRLADSIVRAFGATRTRRHARPIGHRHDRSTPDLAGATRSRSVARPTCPAQFTDPVWSRAPDDAAVRAAGAVSGHASSTDQRQTRVTDDPRWQVDLERPCLVTQVRVYDRNDTALGRPRALVILTSEDGRDWVSQVRRPETGDFGGGPAPVPFVWSAVEPVTARFVRIQILERDYLHSDQVAVFGFAHDDGPPHL